MNHQLPPVDAVLIVCAHPDDESFGLGAIVSGFAEQGGRIGVVCFTHGEASTLHGAVGDLGTVRASELAAAGGVLGVSKVELLEYPDGGLDSIPLRELAEHVVLAARRIQPGLLLVFDDGGVTGHPDHQRATDAARQAAAQLGVPLLAWAIPTQVAVALNAEFSTRFAGRNVDAIDITLAVDRGRQLEAIACHLSQSGYNPVLRRRLELLGPTEHLRYLMHESQGLMARPSNA